MHRTPLAMLLSLAALAIFSASSSAMVIHRHVTVRDPLTHEVIESVIPVDVAPRDSDDDGCRNSKDDYDGPGCKVPPAPPAAQSSVSVAPAPATTSVPSTSVGGCPSYMAGEASSPDAVNASSGAAGCYQVLPSTAQAMGSACSDVNSSSCVAAICATSGNAAWAASGSTPCDYIRP